MHRLDVSPLKGTELIHSKDEVVYFPNVLSATFLSSLALIIIAYMYFLKRDHTSGFMQSHYLHGRESRGKLIRGAYLSGAPIPTASSCGRLNVMLWHIIFVVLSMNLLRITCLAPRIFGKFVDHWLD